MYDLNEITAEKNNNENELKRHFFRFIYLLFIEKNQTISHEGFLSWIQNRMTK